MSICLLKLSLASIVAPKYFTDSLMETKSLLKNKSISGIGLVVLERIIKTEDFWEFTVILLALFHSSTLNNSQFIFSCKVDELGA